MIAIVMIVIAITTEITTVEATTTEADTMHKDQDIKPELEDKIAILDDIRDLLISVGDMERRLSIIWKKATTRIHGVVKE